MRRQMVWDMRKKKAICGHIESPSLNGMEGETGVGLDHLSQPTTTQPWELSPDDFTTLHTSSRLSLTTFWPTSNHLFGG